MKEETLIAYANYFKAIVGIIVVVYVTYILFNKEKFKTPFVLAISGVMTALVAVVTMFIQINIPASQGYLNFGDTMVMLAAILFGPLVGAFAGGVGSALADIFSGYAHWSIFTLMIKGVEGLVVGYLAKGEANYSRILVATIAGSSVMVIGYVGVAYLLYGVAGATIELYNDIVQATTGIIVGGGLGYALKRRLAGIM
ncbi:ECF transporter S component [Pyrococcus yayanosii]|nr:ECF transporter S component [Pyrococcus yayanosii]